MALGASARDVLRLVLRDGLFLTGAGVALGVPLAVLVSFALAAVFVDVGGFDGLVIWIATAAGVAATIAAACTRAANQRRAQSEGTTVRFASSQR